MVSIAASALHCLACRRTCSLVPCPVWLFVLSGSARFIRTSPQVSSRGGSTGSVAQGYSAGVACVREGVGLQLPGRKRWMSQVCSFSVQQTN